MILPIEKQVCSLELAMRLKSLKAPQESLFYWWDIDCEATLEKEKPFKNRRIKIASAYTVAELLELMPPSRKVYKFTEFKDEGNAYTCEQSGDYEDSGTAANACAKLLIHLLENKLITL